MTNTTADQDRMEAAAASVAAKLRAFGAELSPDERAALRVAFGQIGTIAASDDDTAGHRMPTLVGTHVAQQVQAQVAAQELVNQVLAIFGIR